MVLHSLRKIFAALVLCAGFAVLAAVPATASAQAESVVSEGFHPPY